MPSVSNEKSIKWLSCILEERFGHAFTLRSQACNTLTITLEGTSPRIELPWIGNTFTRADSNLSCAQWSPVAEGWNAALHPVLPAPGTDTLPSPLVQPSAQGYRIHYDILGLTYWMLSRQEEVGRTDLDNHGRFAATSSHAYAHGYLERPIVDEWLHILGQIIQRTWPSLSLARHHFSTKVSHDVDWPSRYAFRTLSGLARAMAGDSSSGATLPQPCAHHGSASAAASGCTPPTRPILLTGSWTFQNATG